MKKTLIYLFLFLLGLGIIIAICAVVGFEKIWKNIQAIGWLGTGGFFLAGAVSLALTGVGWWLIMKSYQIKVLPRHATIAHMIAYGMNIFIPSFYIGGEPFRSYYIGRIYCISKTKVFATAIYAKFMELLAFLLFLYIGTVLIVFSPHYGMKIPPAIRDMIIGVDISLGLVFAIFFWGILRNFQMLTRLFTFMRKFASLRKLMDKSIPKVHKMEELFHEVFCHNWRIGFTAFGLASIAVAITFVKPVLIFYCLSNGERMLNWEELALIFTVGQILLSFHITPGGMGLWEGGQIGVFALMGMSSAVAAAFMLIARLSDFLLAGIGGYLIVHFNLVHIPKKELEIKPLDVEDIGIKEEKHG
ncbi:MAG: flippase-like domain-containing protein [Planctomycetes bacterium]|nr:flippase-like domain-containing protein [Planctomycetota bacterium]